MLLRLLILVAGLTSYAAAQTSSFELHLNELQKAATTHRDIGTQHQAMAVLKAMQAHVAAKSPNSTLNTELSALDVTPAPENHNDIAIDISNVLDDVAVGLGSVFTGSGIAQLDITIQGDESAWKSDYVRRGFDHVKPWLDWAGTGLTGASLLLSANGTNGITGSKKATAIGGAGILIISSILQRTIGAKDLNNAAGTVNGVSVNVAQIMMSREAYNQLQTRLDIATKYYNSARDQIQPLQVLRDKARILSKSSSHPTKADLLDLLDKTEAARQQFLSVADFVDVYTNDLENLYKSYAAKYAPLKDELTKEAKAIHTFRDNYNSNIRDILLKNFSSYASTLADLRTQLNSEPNTN
jgi:hypothetical protein